MIFVRCFFSSPRLRFDSRIFLFSAGGLGDFLRRSFARIAISAIRCRSRTLAIASSKRSRASLRFTACERESWTVTLMPVGRCRNVTAVETLFTFWPPGPLDRAKISRRSVSLISSFPIRSANVSCDILYQSTITSSFEKLSQFVFNVRIQRFTFTNELPMAVLEPAQAVCSSTDLSLIGLRIFQQMGVTTRRWRTVLSNCADHRST